MKHFQRELLTNPLTPTSMVNNRGFHFFVLLIWDIRGRYLVCFLTLAASNPSSAGHVSSIKITFWRVWDQITISGRSLVQVISGGKTIFSLSKLAKSSQSVAPSNSDFPDWRFPCLKDFFLPAFTKYCDMCLFLSTFGHLLIADMCSCSVVLIWKRTESCLNVYLFVVRAVLQFDRIWCKVHFSALHNVQQAEVFIPHKWSRSGVFTQFTEALRTKLIILAL